MTMPNIMQLLTRLKYQYICNVKRLTLALFGITGISSQGALALEIDGQLNEAQWQSAQTLETRIESRRPSHTSARSH